MRRIFFILPAILALTAYAVAAGADVVTVAKDKKIKIDYTLTVDGKMIDTSNGKQPLEYTQGAGMIIPGLEKALEGLKVGNEKDVVVSAHDGYGFVDPTAFKEVPVSFFPADVHPQAGMVVQLQDQQGQLIPATIAEVKADSVRLDFNHPLAGKELHFNVKVVSIE